MTASKLTSEQALKASLDGRVLLPSEPGYDAARSIWNGMIDRRPALIVRCGSTADVRRAVEYGRDHGLTVSIRGGGHNIAGNAVCEGGLMIDLSALDEVRVDARARRAQVGPGATLAALDRAAQAHGLATPVGINSTTGIAGLTLGGGFGWLTRKYGMTVDQLISADVITADGRSLHASAEENADLFWALRGGGGNFGVVVNFEFALNPVGPDVFTGLIVFPLNDARSLLAQYREFTRSAPDDLAVWIVARRAPPLPFLPAAVHGQEVLVFAVFYAGDPSEGPALVAPLQRFGRAHGEHFGVQPYTAWQQAFDPLLTPGARNYWKSHNFTTLADGVFDTLVEYAGKLPSPHCEVFIAQLGGKAATVAPDAMAYGHRNADFVMNIHGRWEDPDQDALVMGWTRAAFNAARPFATGGVYVNFMPEDDKDRIPAAFGGNYARLVELKRKYDPGNLFHMNQNIAPQ